MMADVKLSILIIVCVYLYYFAGGFEMNIDRLK